MPLLCLCVREGGERRRRQWGGRVEGKEAHKEVGRETGKEASRE